MPSRSKLIGGAILVVSLVVGVAAVFMMAQRVRTFNERAGFAHLRFDVSTERKFKALGREVTIRDAELDAQPALRVRYGDDEKVVRVTAPAVKDMPDLGLYDEWAKVIEVHEVERNASGAQQDKPGSGRILLVIRNAPEGYDPKTWGSVRRSDWTFTFLEFAPDGTIHQSIRRWPRSELGEMSLKKELAENDPAAKAIEHIEPLQERTWEYQAALHVIPKLNVPAYRFKDTAMRAMGWTLPVAGFAGLGIVAGLGVLLAPKRPDEETT